MKKIQRIWSNRYNAFVLRYKILFFIFSISLALAVLVPFCLAQEEEAPAQGGGGQQEAEEPQNLVWHKKSK